MEKVVIITGANRGIGKAISLYFAQKGYKCILISRSMDKLMILSKEIKETYPKAPKAEMYTCDFLNPENTKDVLRTITHSHHQIDVLVNNAGIYKKGSIENSLDDFKEILNVNVSAPFMFLKAIAPVMMKQGSGYIFNIASRAGKIGFEGSGFYSSSKFALMGLSESLYRELSKSNIKITAICPSYVNTEMALEAGADISGDEMIQVEDISHTIDYLLNLSKDAYIKEVVIECRQTII